MLGHVNRLLTLKMDRRMFVISWLFFSFLTFLLLSTVLKTDRFYYDAAHYWTSSTDFIRNNSFSFANYVTPYRGYFFPFMLMPFRAAAKLLGQQEVLFYNIFAAIAHPFFIVIILPRLIKEIFNKEIKLYMVAAFYALIMFFWYGLVIFPLSDLWAIYFLCFSILIVKTQKLGLWGIIPAGISLGLACNIRPIYLCILPLFLIYILVQDGAIKRKAIALPALIIGIYLAWIPQVMINKANFNTYSPMIQTHVTFGDGLYFTQLNLGFAVEKFETNAADAAKPEVKYFNKKALAIIEKENLPKDRPFQSIGSIFYLFTKFPLDFFSIYASHIFNGFDIKYPETYITDFHRSRLLFSLLNYTVIFIGLFLFFVNYKTVFSSWENILILSIFILPVILVIPTQLEVRFFLPIHLLLYAACCFCSYPIFKEKRYYLLLLLLYVLFIGFCFYISHSTIADISD